MHVLEIPMERKAEIEIFVERFQREPDKYSVRSEWVIIFFAKTLNYVVGQKNEDLPSLLRGDVIGLKCL